ncbi:N(4)-(beta-N-acetylglucosaminyl)-L-asparaginase [Lactobacillus sp. ESL0791]|uniref:N(4)-(beta-N-acetylglucosaminyl)-L-asparaginase n=1 Tax=Lactobacillus sp. ESL0791 TaxID=2983234 RepID=UPI0023F63B34|nr:N(4)-(beta-N-acetylglucosaminyl)-L-asparaginase [Lactobacillus sp. ESL0791]MDF7638309.1 N(4)-(beta-N-acetylglucosaminyl)-L-asparaginase [Lactobacillus sp. ESL0791]
MTWGTIATWRMAAEGINEASKLLKGKGTADDAVEKLVKTVEANPLYKSVGYGGLPNEEGVVQMDAAFMDGDTMAQGAVAAIENVLHAVSVARLLSHQHYNSFRVGAGATKFAQLSGCEMTNMLTAKAKTEWQEKLQKEKNEKMSSYNGHDTVGAITLDQQGSMAAATSTSGLFMKKDGRIGDSPLSGSGLYVDSEVGGAAATGLGEDIMKGCLSYEIVRKMAEGLSPQAACDQTVYPFVHKLKKRYGRVGEISLIALNKQGQWGIATNVEFTFCVATSNEEEKIFMANPGVDDTTVISTVRQ